MELLVRSATPLELPLLLSLEKAIFPDAWGEGALQSHLEGGDAVSLVGLQDGTPVGYALGIRLSGEGELYRIAVLPSARRSGIGRKLLQSFLDDLEENGISACFLEVRASNLPAISLYRAFGFLEVGRRKNYYKNPTEDALLLRRG